MKRILKVLLVVGGIVSLGCGEHSTDVGDISRVKYSGASIVSLHKTSVDWEYEGSRYSLRVGRIKILYRLSVLEPLLYDIEVRLKVEGRSKTVDGWTGIIDDIWTPDMKEGSLFWGEAMTFRFFDDYEKEKNAPESSYYVGEPPSRIKNNLWLETVTISIEPWDALGEGA